MSRLDFGLVVLVVLMFALAIYWQVQVGNGMKG